MKKVLLTCIIALTVYSCSTERDEQLTENPAETVKAKKRELENLKTNHKDSVQTKKTSSDSIIAPAPAPFPIASPANGSLNPGLDPNPNPDPNPDDPEIIPPGDVRPPKK